MSEYSDITKDYVVRSIKNYLIAKNMVEYPFTLALETLQAVSVAISEDRKENLLKIIKNNDVTKELKSISFFSTDEDYKKCFKNIRDGISHLSENYGYINKNSDLDKFRFTCSKMLSYQQYGDITEKEVDQFLKKILTLIYEEKSS